MVWLLIPAAVCLALARVGWLMHKKKFPFDHPNFTDKNKNK